MTVYSKLIFIILVLFIFSIPIQVCAAEKKRDELYVELKFTGTGYQTDKKDSALITFTLSIVFVGDSPPKHLKIGNIIRPPVSNNSIADIMDKSYLVTAILGPWIKIHDNMWVLRGIENGSDLRELPPFVFPLNTTNKKWPNEELQSFLYVGYSYLRLNNKTDKNVHLNVIVNTPNPNDVFYHIVDVSYEEKWDPFYYRSEIWHVSEHKLILSHKNTQAMTFSFLPFLIEYVYPIFLSIFLIADIFYVLRRLHKISRIISNINVNMGNLLRTELAVLGTLITFLITTKDMIPYWYSQIYSDMNELLLCLVGIIIITFIVSLFERHR